MDEGSVESFGVAQGVFGNGEQGGEIALDVEIAIEEGTGEAGFGGIAHDSVEAIAAGEGGGEDGWPRGSREPGPAILSADGERGSAIVAKELRELDGAQHVAGTDGDGINHFPRDESLVRHKQIIGFPPGKFRGASGKNR